MFVLLSIGLSAKFSCIEAKAEGVIDVEEARAIVVLDLGCQTNIQPSTPDAGNFGFEWKIGYAGLINETIAHLGRPIYSVIIHGDFGLVLWYADAGSDHGLIAEEARNLFLFE